MSGSSTLLGAGQGRTRLAFDNEELGLRALRELD